MESDSLQLRAHRRARQGVAMIMVLSVVAIASVLGWAMLSASSMRAQIDLNAVDATEASNLADSGVSYALYYLRYPAKSPVALVQGAYDKHYPGQTALKLWTDARGTVDITVTNTAQYQFTIRSTSRVNGVTQTVEADATLQMQGYQIVSAAALNGPFAVPSPMYIDGPVISSGAVTGATSQITNSPTIVPAGSTVAPTAAEVVLFNETGVAATGTGNSNDRTYTYNGNTYVAEKMSSTTSLALTTARPALNPCNVWYSDSDVTINNLIFTGVIVVRNGKLSMSGLNSLTAPAGMPAVLVSKLVDLKSSAIVPSRTTVTGAMWIGDRISATATNSILASLRVDGALLMGSTAPKADGVNAQMVFNYKPSSVSGVTNLSTVKTIAGVTVTRWQSAN